MGQFANIHGTTNILEEAKEAKLKLRQSLGHPGLDFNSQSDVSIVYFERVTMLLVLGLVPLSIWPLSWSTWLLRSLSWLVMLPVTTRKPGSFPVTFSLLFVTMRS